MSKPRIATAWLDGCSGCHMSLLDIDEAILDLVAAVDLVCSPIMDIKEFPQNVDVTLVEGAVSSEEDLHKIQKIRARTKILVSLGDCAVTGNVPSMRNPYKVDRLFERAYDQNATYPPLAPGGTRRPTVSVPLLLPRARPIHEVVKVDVFVPGCPPPAEAILFVVSELLAGRIPNPSQLTRFGM
ncbi:MAG: NADP oxidoreductase [Phycisphaerae bacterium]